MDQSWNNLAERTEVEVLDKYKVTRLKKAKKEAFYRKRCTSGMEKGAGYLSCWRRHIVKKAWIHTGCEDTMQKWYHWLEDMKKKDEKEKMEEMHQKKVEQMIKSAEGSAGLLHKITRPTPWSGGAQILEKGEEDVKLLDRCEVKRKEWSTHWQCNE